MAENLMATNFPSSPELYFILPSTRYVNGSAIEILKLNSSLAVIKA
jgi:hypothetical protein